ncbi:kinase-like domain-containing protein [Mycena rebaudengoi]|nr:kinase-like domain-containing protein [Mycena rebaudengoi]
MTVVELHDRYNLRLSPTPQAPQADNTEMRDLLTAIVDDVAEMHSLLAMPEKRVLQVMEGLQLELHDPHLSRATRDSFSLALWTLHEQMIIMPPLIDPLNKVHLGNWLGREKVELKPVSSLANKSEVHKRYEREVEKWRRLSHPNIMHVYGIIYTAGDVFTVQPWMDNGTAVEFIQNQTNVDRLKILSEVATGLEYLHAEGIVHGQLRGASVLISQDGSALLSDFGVAQFLEDSGLSTSPNPRWLAPELLADSGRLSKHNITRDVAVLRELDHGRIPDRPAVAHYQLTNELWTLMKKCWHRRPESRPSATTIKTRLLELRGLMPVKSKSFFRRPKTADESHKSSRGHSSLTIPSITTTGLAEPRGDFNSPFPGLVRPSSASALEGGFLLPRLYIDTSKENIVPPYESDRSTPTLISDDETNLETASISGSSQSPRVVLLNMTPTGDVLSGNLEGLVDRCINPCTLFKLDPLFVSDVNAIVFSDTPKNHEFRDILLATFVDFTNP